jgi:hypothetical protein
MEFRQKLYLLLLIVTFGISLFRWKILSQADRWICLLLFLTFVQECAAYLCYKRYGTNLITFHIYTPIELSVIILYFNASLKISKNPLFGVVTTLVCILLAIINIRFFQHLDAFNSYYLLLEGCVVIGLCLLSFYKLLIREEVIPNRMVHFWLIICFLFYWSLTYANFGLYSESVKVGGTVDWIFNIALNSANYLFYLGIATVFIRYKKLIPSGE